MKGLFKFIGLFAFIILKALIGGFVFWNYYYWFVMPVFAIPAISYIEALGLAIFLALFKQDIPDNSPEESYVIKGIGALIRPAILLALGWIMHALFF